ncbi:hypothetical protein [Rickettsiales endosymbiont of Stachyamoeba lipophora]|uniref:hypothetical protein n=1 Tax=Rickettsiales endosymbiont of Stachyamoeba lipophora TaxID=2486578 RepID=UPI000F645E6C|nr:hypothetical protein [Rickettsiales endosymbiont of Stachyamoeba lipophora]AZL16373.1 hypothetical protein EF513_07530 [Rickettsiales endosymbiont of Stachyamoeba lipophora]
MSFSSSSSVKDIDSTLTMINLFVTDKDNNISEEQVINSINSLKKEKLGIASKFIMNLDMENADYQFTPKQQFVLQLVYNKFTNYHADIFSAKVSKISFRRDEGANNIPDVEISPEVKKEADRQLQKLNNNLDKLHRITDEFRTFISKVAMQAVLDKATLSKTDMMTIIRSIQEDFSSKGIDINVQDSGQTALMRATQLDMQDLA